MSTLTLPTASTQSAPTSPSSALLENPRRFWRRFWESRVAPLRMRAFERWSWITLGALTLVVSSVSVVASAFFLLGAGNTAAAQSADARGADSSGTFQQRPHGASDLNGGFSGVRNSLGSHRAAVPTDRSIEHDARTLKLRMPIEPRTLNPISVEGMAAVDIQAYVMETLLRRDDNDQSWRAALAESWTEDANGRSYTFHLRPGAQWSDGEPVTAEDIKFSFDVLFDDRFHTAMMRTYYDGIASVEVLNPQTVIFHTKDSYYGNFISAAQLTVVPKHIYADASKFESLQNTLIGSGPYRVAQWNHGQSLTLERNNLWWGYKKSNEGASQNVDGDRYRVSKMRFVFVSNNQTAIELLKHGDLDFSWLTPDEYLSQNSARFQSVKIQNAIPKNVKSVAFNLSRPIFQDVRVRQALSLLADRRGMIEHLFHGFMLPASGPWYRQSFYADSSAPEFEYNPAQAYTMLRAAGWKLDPHTRLLTKEIDGVMQPLRFTILLNKEEDQRYLTILQESARQLGVDIRLQLLNTTSFNAALISRNFEAADVDHGAVLVEFDPRSTWNSGRLPPNGFNYSGYADPVSDQLIASAMQERDLQKRIPLMQALYRQVVSTMPEIFLFNECDSFYAVSSRVHRPELTHKYDLGVSDWSIDDSQTFASDATLVGSHP